MGLTVINFIAHCDNPKCKNVKVGGIRHLQRSGWGISHSKRIEDRKVYCPKHKDDK